MAANLVGLRVEAVFCSDEFALGFEQVDQLLGGHAFGTTGVKTSVDAEMFYDSVPQALLGKASAILQHEMHDFVAMGLWAEFGAFRGFSHRARHRVDAAIAAVGLSGLESRPIGQLSGGQLQRARFARVTLQDSPLVLLDEPYGAIDANTVRDLAALVRQWHGEGRTVISVLHDFEHVRQEYPETLMLARDAIAYGKTAEVLSEENLLRARRLAEAQGDFSHAPVCHAD